MATPIATQPGCHSMGTANLKRKISAEAPNASGRQRILHAAIEHFGHHGLHGARTRDIAKRAGVTQPLLAYHFSDKETLWEECAAYIFTDFRGRLESRLSSVKSFDVKARLTVLIKEIIESAARNPDAHRFMIRYSMKNDMTKRRKSRAVVQEAADKDLWLRQIREAQRTGLLPKGIDPVILRFIIVGAATYIYLESGAFKDLTGEEPHCREVSERHIDAMLELFLK